MFTASGADKPIDISQQLDSFLIDPRVPSLAAAAVLEGKIVAIGAAGLRKLDDTAHVTLDDKYHLGSCTKSMTATLAAILVKDGIVDWHTTVGESFPDIEIHPDFKDADLEMLLSHTAGCPGNIVNRPIWLKLLQAQGTPGEQRVVLVKGILKEPPEYQPGEGYNYSNAGVSIADAMLEKAAGKPYEQLMQELLFEPLGMNTAGFRAPATPGKVDQPYGHRPDPVPPEPFGDNPRALAPAGAVHCSIEDFAKYARFQLGDGPEGILDKAELANLHTPRKENYAMGWIAAKRNWGGGTVFNHVGSNTMWYAVIWLAPEKDFAVVAASNTGLQEGFLACDNAVSMLIRRFLK